LPHSGLKGNNLGRLRGRAPALKRLTLSRQQWLRQAFVLFTGALCIGSKEMGSTI
jgi:hypothetical protein